MGYAVLSLFFHSSIYFIFLPGRINPNLLSFHEPFPDCVAAKRRRKNPIRNKIEQSNIFMGGTAKRKYKITRFQIHTLSSSSLVSSSRRRISCIVIPCHRSSQQKTCLYKPKVIYNNAIKNNNNQIKIRRRRSRIPMEVGEEPSFCFHNETLDPRL